MLLPLLHSSAQLLSEGFSNAKFGVIVYLSLCAFVKTQPCSMNACRGVRAKLEGRQFDLACQVSRLLGGSKRRWRQR